MQKILIAGFALLVAFGCGRNSSVGPAFAFGTPRAEVVRQIEQLQGEILRESEGFILAEVDHPETQERIRVGIAFEDGVLQRVDFHR